MKAVLLVCFLALFASFAQAAVSRGFYKDAAHPGKCVIKPDMILSEGETKTGPNCQRISCYKDGEAAFATCGAKAVGPPCKLGAFKYPEADYPKCCVNILHCPDGDQEM